MSKCRSVEGLLAVSVYEALDPRDARILDAHLQGCEACRREFEALRTMVAVVPREPVEFTGNLLPALREEIRRRPGRVRVFGWWGFGGAMAVQAPDMPASRYATVQPASPMVEAMALASERMDSANYNGAYQVLKKAVQEHPEDAMAGDAQMVLADLAYSHLYRYADAYQGYETLRMAYNDTFTAAPENTERLALLAEAREVNFASLEALEAARRAGPNSFDRLEAVIGRYPAQMVASLAAEEMARLVASDIADTGVGPSDVLAMEQARDRCTDPVAVARLNLELAETYMTELHNGGQACTLFQQVLDSGNPALAQLAHDTVARLGVDCGA